MAASPAHKLGQVIGIVLQQSIEGLLTRLAGRHGLYIDKAGSRPCRTGKRVSWVDRFGNSHDLDYVLERGGTPRERGAPLAFVEVAWRRYTKHSRNKAQEIQGAVGPLADTYRESAPFLGAVLAGEFTAGSLKQLRSHGFCVLHVSYAAVVAAFAAEGLDVAYDGGTSDEEFRRMVAACEASPKKLAHVGVRLLAGEKEAVEQFLDALETALRRRVRRVLVIRLYGEQFEYDSVRDALAGIPRFIDGPARAEPAGFEVRVEYENGDKVDGYFDSAASARDFLGRFL
jgi:hypothetical protein